MENKSVEDAYSVQLQSAQLALSEENNKQALSMLLQINEQWPNQVEVLTRISAIHMKLGLAPESLPYAKQAVGLEPLNDAASICLLLSLIHNHRDYEAFDEARRFLRENKGLTEEYKQVLKEIEEYEPESK